MYDVLKKKKKCKIEKVNYYVKIYRRFCTMEIL